jgi:hypothetical protein
VTRIHNVKIGESANGTLGLLIFVYDEYSMKKSSGFEWHGRFQEGREDVQDGPRIGQSNTQRAMQIWTEYEPWSAQMDDEVLRH